MRAHEFRYVPALTGLRGIAAWWVVIYHFSEPLERVLPAWMYEVVKQGYLAVDLFFILSGYVLYLAYADSLREMKWRPVWRFWVNRLIRIYPLYIFMVGFYLLNPLALWLFSKSGGELGRYEWDYFFASIFLMQNWGGFNDLQWNIPAWSISAEFAAYLICPLLITMAVPRFTKNQVALLVAIMCGAVGVAFVFAVCGKTSIGESIPTLGVVRCVLEFWMGLCLGALCRTGFPENSHSKILNSLGVVLVVCVIVLLVLLKLPNYFFVPCAFAFLIYILSQEDYVFSRFLSSSVVHYAGVISYSTYLVHYFIKDWVKFLSDSIEFSHFLVYIVACMSASIILFRYVEEPARIFLRRQFLKRAVYDR